ncbi:protein kinase activity [Nesidiocoris tenuis]|uniref:Protein kinase activity n=1 Tax=Nesidiocoris tenuis TaxID=355587 RepID=A0ABN7B204_9HEMI|nr:protein kinase activity [Nesidiocoris tenuis]
MKDPTQKNHFYRNTLKDVLPYIPRKLWFQHVWPCLQQEMRTQEVLAAVLQPILYLIQECSLEEYEDIILPTFRNVFSIPKTIQATVTLLENLHHILEKTPRNEIRSEVLPMLYNSFESTTIQVQSAALVAVTNVSEYLDEMAIRKMVLPKMKTVYEKNSNDLKLVLNVLACIEKTLDRLERSQIIDEVLPLLWEVRLQDADVIVRVVNIYRVMLSDKKYGLSVNVMATRVMPSLLPQTVNPSLNLEQFTILLEVLQEMLDHIDRNQRNKLKLDNMSLPSPERHRPLRHLYSSDNMHVPPFNIPNLRIEQRKTSSAEDMARKNSTDSGVLGGWWFGGSPSSPDSNFLRVVNAFPNRRLSDNTLMTPKIRIAPSCASSPGGTPGTPGSGGLPIRRHSSIGPQERRGSTINLSPPTGFHYHGSVSRDGSTLSVPSAYLARSMIGGSMPNTSSSVPFLLSSSMQSIRSRRPSACLSSSGGSGLLQQLGSGMEEGFRELKRTMSKRKGSTSITSTFLTPLFHPYYLIFLLYYLIFLLYHLIILLEYLFSLLDYLIFPLHYLIFLHNYLLFLLYYLIILLGYLIFLLNYLIFHINYLIFLLNYLIFHINYLIFLLDYLIFRLNYLIFRLNYLILLLNYLIFLLDYLIFLLHYLIFPLHYLIFPLHYLIFPLHYLIFLLHYLIFLLSTSSSSTTTSSSYSPPHLPTPLPHLPTPLPHLPTPLPHLPTPLPHLPTPLPHLSTPLPHLPTRLPHHPTLVCAALLHCSTCSLIIYAYL